MQIGFLPPNCETSQHACTYAHTCTRTCTHADTNLPKQDSNTHLQNEWIMSQEHNMASTQHGCQFQLLRACLRENMISPVCVCVHHLSNQCLSHTVVSELTLRDSQHLLSSSVDKSECIDMWERNIHHFKFQLHTYTLYTHSHKRAQTHTNTQFTWLKINQPAQMLCEWSHTCASFNLIFRLTLACQQANQPSNS